MTETPEEKMKRIIEEARKLRNKKPTNTAFVSTDPYNGNKGGAKKGSQVAPKAARKPSV